MGMRAQGLGDWNWRHGVHRASLDLCCSHNRPHLRSQGWQRALLRPAVAPSPLFAPGGWSFSSLAGTRGHSFTIILLYFIQVVVAEQVMFIHHFPIAHFLPRPYRDAHHHCVPRTYHARTAHVPRTYRARTTVPVWQTQTTISLNCDLWGGWRILQILKPLRAQ